MGKGSLRTAHRALKTGGIILAERGLYLIWPSIFNTAFFKITSEEHERSGISKFQKIKEKHISLRENSCAVELPNTLPLLSSGIKHKIMAHLKDTIRNYYMEVNSGYDLIRVGLKSERRTVSRYWTTLFMGCHIRGTNKKELQPLFSFSIDSAIVREESRHFITSNIIITDKVSKAYQGNVKINYTITTINDVGIPILRTNRTKTVTSRQLCTYIAVRRHKVYKWNQFKSAFSVAKAFVKGFTNKKGYRAHDGLQLFGVGMDFPIDQTFSFHFLFGKF